MKIEEKNGLRILTPESDEYILYSTIKNEYYEKVYLGKNDSIDNYREMEKVLLNKPNENERIQELLDIINKQEAAISNLAIQLEELTLLVNKK